LLRKLRPGRPHLTIKGEASEGCLGEARRAKTGWRKYHSSIAAGISAAATPHRWRS
jgi:hypothetical protein